MLLTEYIEPGHTISELKASGAFTEMAKLRPSAEMALHSKGVRHADLVGRNMVVSDVGARGYC